MKKTKQVKKQQDIWVKASFCLNIDASIDLLDCIAVRSAISKEMAKGWDDEEFGFCAVDGWQPYSEIDPDTAAEPC